MKCSSAFERDYWATLYAIVEASELRSRVEEALDDGRCPPHFKSIWEAHVQGEVATAVGKRFERAIGWNDLTAADCARKLALEQAFQAWKADAQHTALLNLSAFGLDCSIAQKG
jgi:hypothetical protein